VEINNIKTGTYVSTIRELEAWCLAGISFGPSVIFIVCK
jgi:hypothetical protein